MRSVAAWPLVLLSFVACSSDGSPVAATPTPSPDVGHASERLPTISSSADPYLVDRSCDDFASVEDAQDFYIEAGGPDQDIHGLDPDRNGNACDEQVASPSPTATGATVGTSRPVTSTAQPSVAPPKEYHSSSGSVDGKSGGADSSSSCESSDEARCD